MPAIQVEAGLITPQPFGNFAKDYHRSGLQVFPLRGKKPLVRNFNQWSGLSQRAISAWCRRWPEANIGLGTRGAGLVVLDADDVEAIEKFLAIAGDTPLKTQTPKGGQHFYFRDLEGEFWGVNRPGGELYDVKGAGWGDQVVLPGSRAEWDGGFYTLVGDPECHPPSAFAQLLEDIPPLSPQAYRDLTRTPRRTTRITVQQPSYASTHALPGSKVYQGARNSTLFNWACREAHDVARRFGLSGGFTELFTRGLAINAATFEPPLLEREVERVTKSAWHYTVTGQNRPRGRRLLPLRAMMKLLDGHSRAVVLLATLGAGRAIVEFSVAAAHREGLISGWTRNDYQVALDRLVNARCLAIIDEPCRGRGKRGRYRLLQPFESHEVCALVQALDGDADAAVLFQTMYEFWGEGLATVAVRSMVSTFNGPYSSWTERRLRGARTRVEQRGWFERMPVVWTSNCRQAPASFKVRCPSVLTARQNAGDRTRIETPPLEGQALLVQFS